MWSLNPLRQVLCGWVKILRVNSPFSGRFSKGFAVFFRLFQEQMLLVAFPLRATKI
jgi:hypothetical protein